MLIDARKLLIQPYAWDSLKRSLASKSIKIESPGEETSFTTISLDPEPIPLDVKIILTGDEELYELLSERDPDFSDYFKVEADFGTLMDRTEENEIEYAKLIGSLSNKKKLRTLNKQAVARVIEYSSRLAEDSNKLTAHIASDRRFVARSRLLGPRVQLQTNRQKAYRSGGNRSDLSQ